MRIAYIISAYKLPDQLVRLVRKLAHPDSTFLIHIDKKTRRNSVEIVRRGTAEVPNVHFLPRHKCYWGDFGHVKATLEGIAEIKRSDLKPDRVILLTGQDYPLRSHAEMVRFFDRTEGVEFIECDPLPIPNWSGPHEGMRRINFWHLHWHGRWICFPEFRTFHSKFLTRIWGWATKPFESRRRQFPIALRPYGGGSYWCLTGGCIDYIADFVEKTPKYVSFFRHVLIPDELFFQTIVMNSPFATNVISNDLRFVDWSNPNPNLPRVFDDSDVPRIVESGKLFARKFDVVRNPTVLDSLDELLETRHRPLVVA